VGRRGGGKAGNPGAFAAAELNPFPSVGFSSPWAFHGGRIGQSRLGRLGFKGIKQVQRPSPAPTAPWSGVAPWLGAPEGSNRNDRGRGFKSRCRGPKAGDGGFVPTIKQESWIIAEMRLLWCGRQPWGKRYPLGDPRLAKRRTMGGRRALRQKCRLS